MGRSVRAASGKALPSLLGWLHCGYAPVLARYEVHLDRKLERILTILMRLKELQKGGVTWCPNSGPPGLARLVYREGSSFAPQASLSSR